MKWKARRRVPTRNASTPSLMKFDCLRMYSRAVELYMFFDYSTTSTFFFIFFFVIVTFRFFVQFTYINRYIRVPTYKVREFVVVVRYR